MNYSLVETFIEKLENFTISDHYGLISPGFTCYLNSVLQVLFMTKDFRKAVKRSCRKTTIDPHLAELFTALERRMTETDEIVKMLGITDVYKQRDVAEYIEKILGLTSPEASKMFKGELTHKTSCCICNKTHASRSCFWILPLAMEDSHHKAYNVAQALEDFFTVQRVCGDNQWYCTQCDKKQDADIKWEMTQNPDILTLQLKRFTFDYKRRCYMKLDCTATVPLTLCMEKCTYDLYAVINHFGSLTGGHYTADIKSFETGLWYCFNDNIVKSVKLYRDGDEFLRSCVAYLLMYKKVNGQLETTDGSVQEADCEQSDVEDEESTDDAERGEILLPCQLNYEGCKGGETLKHWNDILEKSYDDMMYMKSTNSLRELYNQPHRREAQMRQQMDMFRTDDDERLLPYTSTTQHMWQLNRGSPYHMCKKECRKSSCLKCKAKHVRSCKLETAPTVAKGEKTASQREKKNPIKYDVNVRKKPWK